MAKPRMKRLREIRFSSNDGTLVIPARWVCFDERDKALNSARGKALPQGYTMEDAYKAWWMRNAWRMIARVLLA